MNISQSHYLKQYTCYQFNNFYRDEINLKATTKLTFYGNTPCIYQDLRHEIIDNTDGTDRMYICSWLAGSTEVMILNLHQFNSDNYYQIQMSKRPNFLTIISNTIFIVGGGQLLVIRIDDLSIKSTYNLGYDTIHAVEPAFSLTDHSSVGVWVYAWNDKVGYTKRFYTQKEGHETKWWGSIVNKISPRKAPVQLINTTLKVIIPNVLGLLIYSNSDQICLMNLDTMQLVQNCYVKLTNWTPSKPHRCIVKYHKNKSSQRFDDSLLVSIGQKGKQLIQFFVFHIKYRRQIVQIYAQQNQNATTLPSITSFTSGDALDWNSCVLTNFIAFSTGGSLIDYLLTETGTIYYSNTSSHIPSSAFCRYFDLISNNPILSLEHNICKSYISDLQILDKIEYIKKGSTNQSSNQSTNNYENDITQELQIQVMHSLLRPNRYSLELLYSSIGVQPIDQIKTQMINHRKLLSDWQKLYKTKSIIIFNGDIIILRQNSISSLLPITRQQYLMQYQQGQKFKQALQNREGQGKNSNFQMSLNQSKYSDRLPIENIGSSSNELWSEFKQYKHLAFTYEKQGHLRYNEFEYLDKIPEQKQAFEALGYYTQFYQHFTSKINRQQVPVSQIDRLCSRQQLINNKLLIFAKKIIINRTKDIIHFYSRILRFLYSKSRKAKYDMLNIDTKLQRLIINYLHGMDKMSFESLHQMSAHKTNLIQIFIQKNIRILFDNANKHNLDDNVNMIINVQQQSWKIIYSLFEGLIKEESHITHLNKFIKLLLDHIRSGYYYLQYTLLQIFNPYSSTDNFASFERIKPNKYSPENFCNYSNQQAHFPLTPTLLSIYSYLPVSYSVRKQLITYFVMKRYTGQNGEEIMNQMLISIFATKDFKDKVRQIYYQTFDIKKEYRKRLSLYSGASNKIQNQPPIDHNQINQSIYDQNNQLSIEIDTSRGIIELAKIVQPSILQKHLSKLEPEELQAIFRVNVQYSLRNNMDIDPQNKRIKRKNQTIYSTEDVLIGWVFKYRVYVNKLKYLLKNFKEVKNGQMNNQATSSSHLKQKAYNFVQQCSRSLYNVKTYYTNLYKNMNKTALTLAEVPTKQSQKELNERYEKQKDNFLGQSEEQFIQKVCCRMLGYDSSDSLRLYSQNQRLNNMTNTHQILPTSQFLQLLQQILSQSSTSIESISDLNTIAYHFMYKLFQYMNQRYIDIFKTLCKYYSRKQLNNLIVQNGFMRDKFLEYMYDPKSSQLKKYIGYGPVMQITKKTAQFDLLHPDRKLYQDMEARKKTKDQIIKNIYKNLPFRNAFLESMH